MLHPDVAKLAVVLSGGDFDQAIENVETMVAEAVEELRFGRMPRDLPGGFLLWSYAGYDVHLADGRWVAWAETVGEAGEKLREYARLWGAA